MVNSMKKFVKVIAVSSAMLLMTGFGLENLERIDSLPVVSATDIYGDPRIQVATIKEGDSQMIGTSPARAQITVTSERTGLNETVLADDIGNWEVNIPSDLAIIADEELDVSAVLEDGQRLWTLVTVEASEETSTSETSEETTQAIKHVLNVDQVVADGYGIAGSTSPKATIQIQYMPTGDIWTLDANDSGEWIMELPVNVKEGDVLRVTATSIDNQVATTDMTVIPNEFESYNVEDPKTANFVKVNDIKAGDKKIAGTTTANATVTLFFEKSQDKVTVDADDQGNWIAEVPEGLQLQASDIVNATSNSIDNQTAFVQMKVLPGVEVTQTTKQESKSLLPNTGEAGNILGYVGIILILAGVVVALFRKSNKPGNKQ